MSDPVFLHSGWRCSSTWVWSRFRALDEALAFYEPFHEGLATLTPAAIERGRAETSGLNHPALGRPYMAEYGPLLKAGGGVAGYRSRFAMAAHFMAAEAFDLPQEAYVAGLVGLAQAAGRTPVLACCRSMGRAPWLRRRFGGLHLVLARDPVSQWASGHAQRRRPAIACYFEYAPFAILLRAGGAAADWARRWGAPRPKAGDGPDADLRRLRRRMGGMSPEDSYAGFAAAWLLSQQAALPVTDLVIDVDRLGREAAYRRAIELGVSEACGLPVDFQGCATPAHGAVPDVDFTGVHAALAAAFPQTRVPGAPGLIAQLERSAARARRAKAQLGVREAPCIPPPPSMSPIPSAWPS